MLGDGARIGATIVAYQNAGATCRVQIHPVVAGAEQLHQPQPGRGAVERIVHVFDVAEQVFGVGQRGGISRAAGRGDDEFEAGRRHFARLLDCFGSGIDEQDLRRHGGFPRWFGEQHNGDRVLRHGPRNRRANHDCKP